MIIFSDIHLDYPSFNYDIHNHKHLKESINNKLWIAPTTINNITPYIYTKIIGWKVLTLLVFN